MYTNLANQLGMPNTLMQKAWINPTNKWGKCNLCKVRANERFLITVKETNG